MTEPIVILWWGAQLWILGDGPAPSMHALESGKDPASSIVRIATGEAPSARSARIVYHPDTLETHLAPCPGPGRARLRRALGRRYPQLAEPDAVWSADPRRAGSGDWNAVLHLERDSTLPRLVAALRRRGIRVEGAWPILSVLESLPACSEATRGYVGLVSAGESALVSCLDPAGNRLLQVRSGAGFAAAAGSDLSSALARFDEADPPPVFAAVGPGTDAAGLRESLPPDRVADVGWADFLGRVRALDPGASGDFLPPEPAWRRWLSRPAALAAAIGLLLLAAALIALLAAHERELAKRRIEADRILRLRAEEAAESRLARDSKIQRLSRDLASLAGPVRHPYELLMALARSTPKAILLRSVEVEADRFTVRGSVCEGAGRPDGPLAALDRAMASAGRTWTWLGPEPDSPGPSTDPDFVRRGAFRDPGNSPSPGDGPHPPEPAELEARDAAERARLDTPEGFAGWLESWNRRWEMMARSSDGPADPEVRHYTFGYSHPSLGDWSDLVRSLEPLEQQPGLTIDSLILAGAPDGSDRFAQAQLTVTVRLRG